MNCRYTYQKVCQVLLLLLWVSWAGCQREEIIPEAGTSEPGETRMNPSVLILDTTDLTNPFRTNGQVRFDIIGDLPEIQKGKHFFYPLSGGIYGSVTQYIVNGSRLTIDLSRTALETVWKEVFLSDSIRTGQHSGRERFLPGSWINDTLFFKDTWLFNDLVEGNPLQVLVKEGKLFSSVDCKHQLAGSGSDPWLKRYCLSSDWDTYLALDVRIETRGNMNTRDSVMIEELTYGPYWSGSLPVYYITRTYLGFDIKALSDTTLTLNFSARESGKSVMVGNHWSDWDIIQSTDYQSINVLSHSITRFAESKAELYLCRTISPIYSGETAIKMSNRLSASVTCEVAIPEWTVSVDAIHSVYADKTGSALTVEENVPSGQATVLYHTSSSGTLPNQKPKATFTVDPASGYTDTNFEFDATGCTDLESSVDLLEVRWDFDADSHFDTEYTTSKTILHVFSKPGTYQTVLEVRDPEGLTSTVTRTIQVALSSSAPTAHFTVTPESGRTSDYYLFDASSSYDAQDDVTQLKVRWDFNGDDFWDTPFSTTKAAVFFFTEPGTYVAKLEVLDTQGLTGQTTRLITVLPVNLKPTAIYTVDPESGTTETIFRFDASGSSDPEDAADLLTVRWDWDRDGVFDTDYSTLKTAQHRFSVAATYVPLLEVMDTEGLSSTYSATIVVRNPNTPPEADFSINPLTGDTTTLFTFDASICTDLEDPVDILEVRWDWENDDIYDTDYTTEKVARRTFTVAGTYIVKMQVKDSEGLTDTKARLVIVE